jgi:hypothetical protein
MPSERLIERGRLVYQALECKEQAARYRAAAVSLMEAITLAECGDPSKLQSLIDAMDQDPSVLNTPWPEETKALLQQASLKELTESKPATQAPATQAPATQATATQATATQAAATQAPTTQATATQAAATKKSPSGTLAVGPARASDKKPNPPPARGAPPAGITPPARGTPSDLVGFKPRRTKRGAEVFVSLGIHVALLMILGFWVVVQVQRTEILSIVAGTVESEDVLIETPMESISELEATSTDSPAISTPETSSMAIEVNTDSISVDKVDLGIEAIGAVSSISEQMSKAGASGSKLVEGAEFFGSKATGNRFVYVVDASPSMRRDGAFEAAKEEILRSLRSMKPKQRFGVIFFGGELRHLEFELGQKPDGPVNATQENIEKAVEWLRKVTVQKDGRPPIDAIESALEFQPDGIFLLFDGDTKMDNWTQTVRELNTSDGFLSDGGTQVPIHVIHFFREEFQGAMQLLAHQNGGTYRFVPKPGFRVAP